MAKIKRFYLLIAALIYSKSYYSAYALTQNECTMAAWLFNKAINVDCDNYNTTITCDNQSTVNSTVWKQANDYNSDYADFWESWGYEIMECTLHGYGQQPAASTFFDCDKMQNLGCYDHSSGNDEDTEQDPDCIYKSCDDGRGYDPIEDWCMKCDGGQYVKHNQHIQGEQNCYIGPVCTDCPGYYAEDGTYIDAYTSTNDEPGSTIQSCFIANSDLWGFSDATGAGYKNFSYDCYYGS